MTIHDFNTPKISVNILKLYNRTKKYKNGSSFLKKNCKFVLKINKFKRMNSTIQLKNNLISRIKNSTDIQFLKALQTIFDSSEQSLFKLNEEQEKSIQISKEQIANGEYIENSALMLNLKEWLKKK